MWAGLAAGTGSWWRWVCPRPVWCRGPAVQAGRACVACWLVAHRWWCHVLGCVRQLCASCGAMAWWQGVGGACGGWRASQGGVVAWCRMCVACLVGHVAVALLGMWSMNGGGRVVRRGAAGGAHDDLCWEGLRKDCAWACRGAGLCCMTAACTPRAASAGCLLADGSTWWQQQCLSVSALASPCMWSWEPGAHVMSRHKVFVCLLCIIACSAAFHVAAGGH